MIKLWLRIKERAIRNMMDSGASADLVLTGARRFLMSRDGKVQSEVFSEAMLYVAREKFSGWSDPEVRDLARTAQYGKTLENALAKLECVRRDRL